MTAILWLVGYFVGMVLFYLVGVTAFAIWAAVTYDDEVIDRFLEKLDDSKVFSVFRTRTGNPKDCMMIVGIWTMSMLFWPVSLVHALSTSADLLIDCANDSQNEEE